MEHWQEVEIKASQRVADALRLPLPKTEDLLGVVGEFDPWDLFPAVYGSYDSEFDRCAIEILCEVRDGVRGRRDLAADFFREMLCTASLCDYGTSPRGCFPSSSFKPLLEPLIKKWRGYSLIAWGEDVALVDSQTQP